MTGSSPQPAPKQPRTVKRRRTNQSSLPVTAMAALFGVYLLIGLLLSFPMPPIWVWVPAVVGIILLTIGLNRPAGDASAKVGLFAYIGALLLVIALAIAANYIGGQDSLDGVGFFQAIFGLAALTILAVALAAGAAITSAQAGASLMRTKDYSGSLTIVISTSLLATCLGGLIGFVIATALTSAAA